MSSNSEKGRKGELAVTSVFSTMGIYEPKIEVIRDSTSNTPDNGVDLALKVPHNLSSKLDQIAGSGTSDAALSNTSVNVRVQVKNYPDKPINKPTMQGFVNDINKNLNFDEHWGIGGTRLTKGAQEVLEEAKKIAPVKWYTIPEFSRIQAQYPEVPFSEINNAKKK